MELGRSFEKDIEANNFVSPSVLKQTSDTIWQKTGHRASTALNKLKS